MESVKIQRRAAALQQISFGEGEAVVLGQRLRHIARVGGWAASQCPSPSSQHRQRVRRVRRRGRASGLRVRMHRAADLRVSFMGRIRSSWKRRNRVGC